MQQVGASVTDSTIVKKTASGDAITVEVIRHGLTAAAEQMAASIERSAHSQVIREMLDYSTAIFDLNGGIVAQSTRIPIHLNSMSHALGRVLTSHFPLEEWSEGDVFMTNDPYSGGQHLPDIQTFAPVFLGNEAIAIVGTLGHHLDVGGRAVGSYGADATDIYQEGFRIPPVRVIERGMVVELFFRLLEANIRVPRKTVSDLRAQIAALTIGANEVARIARRFDAITLQAATAEIVSSSERRMRAAIAQLPLGVFSAEDVVDGDGLDDVPIPICASIERRGDDLVVDLSASSPQVRGPINSPIASTESAVYYAVSAILDTGGVPNRGTYRPIRVIAPTGSVVNPTPPAAVVGRNVVCHRIANVVMTALGRAVPDRAVAAYYGNSNVYVFSSYDDAGQAQVLFEIEVGGWGARPRSDGPDVLSDGLHNLANNPVELVETEFPIRISQYGLRPDSAGAGKYRGGLGAVRTFEILADCTLSTQFDRVKFPPPGISGGNAGAAAKILLERNGATAELPAKTIAYRLQKGDRVAIFTQGGGGLGNPRERHPSAVAADVAAGKVSADAASILYGFDIRRSA